MKSDLIVHQIAREFQDCMEWKADHYDQHTLVPFMLPAGCDVDMSAELLPKELQCSIEKMVDNSMGSTGLLQSMEVRRSRSALISFTRALDDHEQSTSRSRKGLLRIEL